MKCCKILTGFILLIWGAVSCMAPDRNISSVPGARDLSEMRFSFDPSAMQHATRSAMVSEEGIIHDINLFLYRNGRLEWEEYRESSDPVVLKLLDGETYSVYALANVGRRQAPASEQAIHDYALDLPLDAFGGRIPMVSAPALHITVSPSSSGAVAASNEVAVPMVRLAAKYNFRVDRSALRHGTFSVESVRLRQAARRMEVFAPEHAAGEVYDGDYASAADLALLNASSAIAVYPLENRQGTLLPGNTDPWRKEYFDPDVAAVASSCTYLEVKGRYRDHSGALSALHTYRMYLGTDATTNFDVTRNTEYTLTLVVSDLGVYRDSWKVERGDVTDRRQLYFDPAVVEMEALATGTTSVVSNPSGIDYTLEWDRDAFRAAALSDPVLSGSQVRLESQAELDEDARVLLRAVSFDGAVEAVCTLLVKSGALPDLQLEWATAPPAYVAQAGTLHCSNVLEGSVLSASVSDPSVARLVQQGNDYRVEALKEGSVTLTVTRTDGSRSSVCTCDLTVSPVYLQVGGTYRAFADGSANALRIDNGSNTPWSLSYDLPRSAFDDALYQELLSPRYRAVKEGSTTAVEYFEVDEQGLYVVDWGNDLAALPGTYQLTLTPKADIYAGSMVSLSRTVVIDEPLRFASGTVFAGENRYYMPDTEEAMTLVSSGTAVMGLGDASNLKLCIGFPTGGYGEGSGYVACPYDWIPAADGSGSLLRLQPTYAELVSHFPSPYTFRGTYLYVFARLTNARSGVSSDIRLSGTEIWLDFAVTSKLESWPSASDWDVTDEDHYFIVPCLYNDKFVPNLITSQSSSAGGGGDVSLPPFYIPQAILSEIPKTISLDGAQICLSEPYPARPAWPDYLSFQLLSREYGSLLCPDITNWLWDECSFSEDDFARESYESLGSRTGQWYHKKLYWRLYDPNTRQLIPEGGHLDIKSYGGFTGNYYLRLYDYAVPLDASDFEE